MFHQTHPHTIASRIPARRRQWKGWQLMVSLLTMGLVTVSTASASPVTLTASLLGGPGFRIGGIASLDIDVDPAQFQVCFTAGVRSTGGITRVSLVPSAAFGWGGEPIILPIQQIIRSGAGELATGCTSLSPYLAGGLVLSSGSYAIQVDFQQGTARGDLHLP